MVWVSAFKSLLGAWENHDALCWAFRSNDFIYAAKRTCSPSEKHVRMLPIESGIEIIVPGDACWRSPGTLTGRPSFGEEQPGPSRTQMVLPKLSLGSP